jgi:hypothetical protein
VRIRLRPQVFAAITLVTKSVKCAAVENPCTCWTCESCWRSTAGFSLNAGYSGFSAGVRAKSAATPRRNNHRLLFPNQQRRLLCRRCSHRLPQICKLKQGYISASIVSLFSRGSGGQRFRLHAFRRENNQIHAPIVGSPFLGLVGIGGNVLGITRDRHARGGNFEAVSK